MSGGKFHRLDRTISGSFLLEKLGDSLREIKNEDRLTDADLGRVLGKHADSVSTYRGGDGDMGVVSFLFGCEKWDGRFANPVLRHLGVKMVRVPQVLASRARASRVCRAPILPRPGRRGRCEGGSAMPSTS